MILFTIPSGLVDTPFSYSIVVPTSFCYHANLIHPCVHTCIRCRVPQGAHSGGSGGAVHSKPPADQAAEECCSGLDHTPSRCHCISHGDPVQVSF